MYIIIMPIMPKCSTSLKYKAISLFKVSTPDKTNDKWTKYLIDIILKYRVKDQSLINVYSGIPEKRDPGP